MAPDSTPWGGLSDHLVLSNGSTPLNGTTKVVILGGMNLTSWFQSASLAFASQRRSLLGRVRMPAPQPGGVGLSEPPPRCGVVL